MGWEDEIIEDGSVILLEEGDYDFEVTNFERGTFPGSEKIPYCNKAVLTLEVETERGNARVITDLIMYRSLEWRVSAFFRSIGLKKSGEPLKMDWTKVVGARGRAHFKPKTYLDKTGGERRVNEVARFIDFEPSELTGWQPGQL